jgi:nitrate/nitrite-specific signal transduction histidine kinase
MRAQADELGSVLQISSSPGQGTTVKVIVQLNPQPGAQAAVAAGR